MCNCAEQCKLQNISEKTLYYDSLQNLSQFGWFGHFIPFGCFGNIWWIWVVLIKTHFLYNFIPRVIFFENLTKEICCLKFRLKIIAFKLLSLNISPLKAFMSQVKGASSPWDFTKFLPIFLTRYSIYSRKFLNANLRNKSWKQIKGCTVIFRYKLFGYHKNTNS